MGRLWYTDSHGKRKRTPEGYKSDYRKFQSSEEAKKDRASRNAARRHAISRGTVSRGDTREVHHTNGVRDNSHTRVISRSENRAKREKSRLKRSPRNKRNWGR